ncbi:KTSC domain-containing protein [Xaviernesmea oryzae]|uniref:KTSC domain-containing protein n=1 Tax=Xaviernesmea oryzae TaxID=464029 RepID=A0A1Q9ASS3_9HYPH|nr:KTSC domain-containing protein [Xaviernesmea oryzae]OLP58419.1 KTSC domain-containing protein [Xaviernesmea oryzae]SEM21482.1 KTSC domain-containing protein [Xaviernesmea oryzae]
MQHLPVKSRIIDSVYFSQEDGQLRICFKNGEERRFAEVQETEVLAMCEARSPGQYYIDNIRTRFRRIAA